MPAPELKAPQHDPDGHFAQGNRLGNPTFRARRGLHQSVQALTAELRAAAEAGDPLAAHLLDTLARTAEAI